MVGPSLLDVTNLELPSAVEHVFDARPKMMAPKLVDGVKACGARGGSGSQMCSPLPRLTCMSLYSVIQWIVFIKQAEMSLVGGVTR